MSGTLYFGDNLDILRNHIITESIDLIYLDPPFNSKASYAILFESPDGSKSSSQIQAFEDTWSWNDTSQAAFEDTLRCGHTAIADVLRSLRQFLGENDVMAYLAMMSIRIVELRRVLKETGSIYLHCDPTASHYLKVILDAAFGIRQFRNEIIWKRTRGHYDKKLSKFGSVHDTIFYYSKSENRIFNQTLGERDKNAPKTHDLFIHTGGKTYRKGDCRAPGNRGPLYEWNGHTFHWRYSPAERDRLIAEGRIVYTKNGMPRVLRPVEPLKGIPLQDVWTDIDALNAGSNEILGYPTQKPVTLLERIIASSTDPGNIVLDPFCGCGTAVHAAQRLRRRWLGIDVTPLAINLIGRRLNDAFPEIVFNVRGIPRDMDGARELALRDKHLFQLWCVDLVDAQPFRNGQKGADGGIDGLIYFKADDKVTKAAIVAVKGGLNVGVAQIKDLRATMERTGEPLGVFLTLTPPTRPMEKEAASAGSYETGHHRIPRIQILTIEQLLAGQRPRIPFGHTISYRRTRRERSRDTQTSLL